MYLSDIVIVVPAGTRQDHGVLEAFYNNGIDYTAQFSSDGKYINYNFQSMWAPEVDMNSSHDFIEALSITEEYLFLRVGQDIQDIEVHGNSDLVKCTIKLSVDWNE